MQENVCLWVIVTHPLNFPVRSLLYAFVIGAQMMNFSVSRQCLDFRVIKLNLLWPINRSSTSFHFPFGKKKSFRSFFVAACFFWFVADNRQLYRWLIRLPVLLEVWIQIWTVLQRLTKWNNSTFILICGWWSLKSYVMWLFIGSTKDWWSLYCRIW